jgi:hypothetical protein
MREVCGCHKASISGQAEQDMDRRITVLEASVQRAKADRGFARQFLSKMNL